MKKKLIVRKSDYFTLRRIMTFEGFHSKFKLSTKVVTQLLADDAVNMLSGCDRLSRESQMKIISFN